MTAQPEQQTGLDVLGGASSFLGGFPIPGITGGHAGPSSAGGTSNQSSWMASPFAVGQGATATATPTVGATGGLPSSNIMTYALLGLVAVVVISMVRK